MKKNTQKEPFLLDNTNNNNNDIEKIDDIDNDSCVPSLNNKGKLVNFWVCFAIGMYYNNKRIENYINSYLN